MTLEPGQELLHYRLVDRLGEGGMGVVWRAVDTTLEREVAIKLLPDAFAADADRSARFEREAKLLAGLNHPHIAAVYGLHVSGEAGHPPFIAMELVEGEDLAALIERGPVAPELATRIALQIAEALEAAHERGVIHRDLKPANVRLTPEGRVKVLDFGLATSVAPSDVTGDPSASPTLTSAGTAMGVILGTAAYMSPEQARGEPVDRRTDIWSFGCVLYELLTGERPFPGRGITETLGAVLHTTPDLDRLPAGATPAQRRVIRRCFVKDPRDRLRDVGDARIALQEPEALDGAAPPAPPRRAVWPVAVAALLAGAVVGALAAVALLERGQDGVSSRRVAFDVAMPSERTPWIGDNVAVAVSPDGRRMAMVLEAPDGLTRLAVRTVDDPEVVELPGTRGGYGPFFSPDGKWLGYFDVASAELRTIRIDGGRPNTIARAAVSSRGGSWGENGTIVYSDGYRGPLLAVPAEGGEPRPVTELRTGEKSHRFPHLLPGGRDVLFMVGDWELESFDDATIAVRSLDGGERRDLIHGGLVPRFRPPDTLLYARRGELLAVRFDPGRLEVSGTPEAVLDGLVTSGVQGPAQYAVARDGTLVWIPGGTGYDSNALAVFDRSGRRLPLDIDERPIVRAALSPDGGRLALAIEAANAQVWTFDLDRGILARIQHPEEIGFPAWMPGGESLLLVHAGEGVDRLVELAADGSGAARVVGEFPSGAVLESVHPDGARAAIMRAGQSGSLDLAEFDLTSPGEPAPLVATAANESYPAYSPDGRWLAYTSDESGVPEVYVTPYPGGGSRWQVSSGGGIEPAWRADLGEIYFRTPDGVSAARVRIDGAGRFRTAEPAQLFAAPPTPNLGPVRTWSVSPDGERFYLILPGSETHANVVRVEIGTR